MPKIIELAKMLYSHQRNIYCRIYTHHVIYTIPTYDDCVTPRIVSVIDNGCGSMEITARRDPECKWYKYTPASASKPEINKLPVEHIDARPSENLPYETSSKRRGDYIYEWRLPL